jgi:hypothetical protein
MIKQHYLYSLAIIILIASPLIAYSGSFSGDFHFDDYQLLNNKYYHSISNIPSLFLSDRGPDTRPVTNATFMINYQYCGLNVNCYHAVNFVIHAVNGIVLFLFLLITLKPYFPKRFGEVSFFVSLLFLVHPIQTGAVTYIVQRYEILTAMFVLFTLLFIRIYIEKKNKIFVIIAILCSSLAMGSKEIAVALPFIVFLYDLIIVSEGHMREVKKRWWMHILFFSTLLILMYFMRFSLDIFFMDQVPRSGVSKISHEISSEGSNIITPYVYSLTQVRVIWTYIRLLFMPIDQNLDYDYPLITSINSIVIVSVVGIILLITLAIVLFKRRPVISFSILWFFIMLAPTSSFAMLPDVIFEHRLYLPSVGFILMIVSFLYGIFIEERSGSWGSKDYENTVSD